MLWTWKFYFICFISLANFAWLNRFSFSLVDPVSNPMINSDSDITSGSLSQGRKFLMSV